MERQKNDQQGEAFIKGALLLGVTGIIVKIMGAFFKIPLANILGPEGIGYYNTAYPIYNFFIMLATTGLPTALAKIISEQRAIGEYGDLDRTYKAGLVLMLFIGVTGSVLMFFGAPLIVGVIKNEKAIFSFYTLAPAILFTSVMAVYRGYFQGFQMMKPFAISQIFEQFFRVVLGYGLAVYLLTNGPEFASAGATFGATTGGIAGFLIVFWMYKRYRKTLQSTIESTVMKLQTPMKVLIKRIVLIAVPITLGATVMPLMGVIDVGLVINRLHDIGLGEQANSLYGLLTGYAATLVTLPQVVISAIQISIVPAVAGFYIQNQVKALKEIIENGVRMALIISLPATAGLVILAEPIMILLYPRQIMHVETTGRILVILGFGVVFLSLFQVTTGILQGISLQNRPALNLMVGAVAKVILTYVLVGIPSINIYGAAISSVAAYVIATTLNFVTLKKRAQVTFDLHQVLVKPLISVAMMSLSVIVLYNVFGLFLPGKLTTVITIGVGVLVYFYMLLRTGTLHDEDFKMLPGGAKLQKVSNWVLKK